MFLLMMGLITECRTGREITNDCSFEKLESCLSNNHSDDYLGDYNLFQHVLKGIKEIMNFQFEIFTITLFRTSEMICKNIKKFREDFQINYLFRIMNKGKEFCYVIISKLKPYWITSSLTNFISGWKKIKLFDGRKNGNFIWVRLKL